MKKTLTKAMAMTLAFILLFGSAAAGIGGFAQVLDTISVRASAADTEYTDSVSGLNFTLTNNTATITSYSSNLNVSNGNFIIPDKVNESGTYYDIVSIGDKAFYGCNDIVTLTIPKGITSIGDAAFSGMRKLKTVYFNANGNICNRHPLLNSNNSIFYDSTIEKIVFGDNVTQISEFVCSNATLLKECVFKGNVTSIGYRSFSNTALSDIDLTGVITIGVEAFAYCKKIETVTIPETTTKIENSAFAWMTSLETVYFNANGTGVASDDICGRNPMLSHEYSIFDQSAVEKIVFGNNVSKISQFVCSNATSLKECVFKGNITLIGDWSFYNCPSLSKINCDTMSENYWNSKVKPNICSGNDILSSSDVTYHFATDYNLTYNANGGSGAPANQTGNGSIALSTVRPTREGYTFKGWAATSTATTAQYQPGAAYNLTANATLYAVWEKNAPVTYTLTYSANNGSGAPAKQTGNGSITLSSVIPTRDGYTFLGWSTSTTATIAQYQPGAKFNLTKNTVLFAVWQKNAPAQPDVSKAVITAPSGTKTVNWKYKAHLFASASNLPDGYKVVWYEGKAKVSDGSDYTSANLTSNHTYTAKIVDGSGKIVSTSAQEKTVTITVKTDFISKLISFFSRLFVGDVTDIK